MRNFISVFAVVTSGFVTCCSLHLLTKDVSNGSELTVADVEALSDPEWNPWYKWISDGFTKDEREERIPCQGTSSVSVGGSVSKGGVTGSGTVTVTKPTGKYKITCPSGEDNCDSVDC